MEEFIYLNTYILNQIKLYIEISTLKEKIKI